MAISPVFDRERAKRYKKWWARQKGTPQGELIHVASDAWIRPGPPQLNKDHDREEAVP